MTDDLLRKFAELNPVADPGRIIALEPLDLPADPVLRALLERTPISNGGPPDPAGSVHVRTTWPAHRRGAPQGRNGDTQATKVRPEQRPTVHGRPRRLGVAVSAAAVVLAVAAGLVAINDRAPAPVVSGNAVTNVNGWVAFPVGGDDGDHDIYLAGLERPALRVTGSDSDGLDEQCPAFSSDGTRLAYGQAAGTSDTGHSDSTLIIADVAIDGSLTEVLRVEMGTGAAPPCPTWSPTGDRIAVGVRVSADSNTAGDIWIVSTANGMATVLEDRYVPHDPFYSDMEWSPDGTELAVSDHGGISLYSAARGTWRSLPDTPGAQTLTWSPDGTFAYESNFDGSRTDYRAVHARGGRTEIRIAEIDGPANYLLAGGYGANQGIGPVWSPTGEHLVYQRICDGFPSGISSSQPCRERHDVVLVTPDGSETVLPHVRLPGSDAIAWPSRVTWSPDGSYLLYEAWVETAPYDALIAVPLDPNSAPVVLYEGPIAGQDPLASQMWGRQPQAAPSN